MLGTTFAGGDAADNFRAVIEHLLRMKTAFAAGEALHQHPRIVADKHAHRAPPASFTTFSAPSFIPLAMVKFRPELRRISWPCFTLVPSIRTTTGILNFNSFAAFTTPLARTSQRRMPPKIFTKTALTLGSLNKMRKAFFT